MFANPKFSRRKAPLFKSSYVFEGEEARTSIPYLHAYIFNDSDRPPKTLVAIDVFDIPLDAEGLLKGKYDFIGGVGLLPEDAIKLAKHLNKLVGEIFKESNYRR